MPAQGESTRHTGPLPASRQVDANDPQLHGLKTSVPKTDKGDAADKGPPGESAPGEVQTLGWPIQALAGPRHGMV